MYMYMYDQINTQAFIFYKNCTCTLYVLAFNGTRLKALAISGINPIHNYTCSSFWIFLNSIDVYSIIIQYIM